jgi:uncharacterized protein YxeA
MKRLLLVMCLIILTGCTSKETSEDITQYNRFIKETNSYSEKDISKEIPFTISVYFEKLIDEELTYRVIIDNPTEDITNIKAIAIPSVKTKDVYPTSGIFETPLNLIPNNIDLKKNNAKGIILIGYVDYKGNIDDFTGTVKVLIKYNTTKKVDNKIYYVYHNGTK